MVLRRHPKVLPVIEPSVPVLRAETFDDPAYLFEPKYDGFRGLLYVSARECHFRSKRGNVLTRFRELAYWVREELPVKDAIIDGEVVALEVLDRLVTATTTVVSKVFAAEERGGELLAAAERLNLEGIVAKGKADPYGPETVWYKVKNRAYTQMAGRWELFQRARAHTD